MKEKILIITPVIDYEMFNNVIRDNKFIKNSQLYDIDNRKENNHISKCYNKFLDSYNFSEDSWIIFCHEDFEFLENIEEKLKNLSKKNIYGPVGVKTLGINVLKKIIFCKAVGSFKDKNKNGLNERENYNISKSGKVDTVDCMCMIVHSSLVKKYNLRFDEKLKWNLYVEDFCISAKIKHKISTKVFELDCCHWSQLADLNDRNSYFEDLQYLNNEKYQKSIYAGTCSLIGGGAKNFQLKLKEKLKFIKKIKFKLFIYVTKFRIQE